LSSFSPLFSSFLLHHPFGTYITPRPSASIWPRAPACGGARTRTRHDGDAHVGWRLRWRPSSSSPRSAAALVCNQAATRPRLRPAPLVLGARWPHLRASAQRPCTHQRALLVAGWGKSNIHMCWSLLVPGEARKTTNFIFIPPHFYMRV
jgi:hypothetical protein